MRLELMEEAWTKDMGEHARAQDRCKRARENMGTGCASLGGGR